MPISFKVLSFLVLGLAFLYYKTVEFVSPSNLSQLTRKPLIFGEELCVEISSNVISITSNVLQIILCMFSPKIVLQGKIGNQSIILKRINDEGLFQNISLKFHDYFNDEVLNSSNAIDTVKSHIYSSIRFQAGTVVNPKFRLCPYSSNVENLLSKIHVGDYSLAHYFHLWTALQIDPEPIVLKFLKPPIWPVPKLFGSCGWLTVVEDCGTILTDYYYADWPMRSDLAHQLLHAALQFTFQDPDFAYYFTDLNPDNIAVSESGKLKIIDLENIIIVDKKPLLDEESLEAWEYNHTTRHFPCKDCIVIDAEEICLHKTSDHNIYAVCKEIFSESSLFPEGFLHSKPASPLFEDLYDLITSCVESHDESRFGTAYKLMSLLSAP